VGLGQQKKRALPVVRDTLDALTGAACAVCRRGTKMFLALYIMYALTQAILFVRFVDGLPKNSGFVFLIFLIAPFISVLSVFVILDFLIRILIGANKEDRK
jgi:hypothetical protein